jgi:UDP-N-acetylmuramate dehydrogenase
VEAGFGGLENLSLIPGTVGAAPVQNIGAYGVELKDVFVRLRAVDLETGGEVVFFHADCAFGYRDSLFKHAAKGRYFITSVTFRLSVGAHRLKLEYGDISRQLAEMGISRPGIADVSHAVTAIRKSKLPDPAELGNAGSFFKNPTVHKSVSGKIKSAFPNLPTFPGIDPDYEKIPAGWLIEQCGWKGKRLGKVGVFPRQALVLVNYGKASGKEIWQLAQDIITSVRVRFDITLEPEVNLL